MLFITENGKRSLNHFPNRLETKLIFHDFALDLNQMRGRNGWKKTGLGTYHAGIFGITIAVI
jgi:hypothetical protein